MFYSEISYRENQRVCDVIDVKARIDFEYRREHIIKGIAAILVRVWRSREWRRWGRVSQVCVGVVGVTTSVAILMERLKESIVQVEEIGPVIDVWNDGVLLLQRSITNDRIIDSNSPEIEVIRIIGFKERIGNVRNVKAAVRFTSNVRLAALDVESVDEILPEALELICELQLVGDVRSPLREAGAHRLFNPDVVGQVGERVWIRRWR